MAALKRQLTPLERQTIVSRYNDGNITMAALAKEYGVSKSTISRALKKSKPAEKKEPVQISGTISDCPILFRRMKIAEIAMDISAAREERTIHCLPAFHKLHINVHSEMLEHIEAASDEMREMSIDDQRNLLIDAFSSLPARLRHELLEQLEALESGNVIRIAR